MDIERLYRCGDNISTLSANALEDLYLHLPICRGVLWKASPIHF